MNNFAVDSGVAQVVCFMMGAVALAATGFLALLAWATTVVRRWSHSKIASFVNPIQTLCRISPLQIVRSLLQGR